MKLLQRMAPPAARMASRARRMGGDSGSWPVSLRAKYALTETLTSSGPPGWLLQPPSAILLAQDVAGGLAHLVVAFAAQERQQEDVFRLEDGVALQFADPVAVGFLLVKQALPGAVDGLVNGGGRTIRANAPGGDSGAS